MCFDGVDAVLLHVGGHRTVLQTFGGKSASGVCALGVGAFISMLRAGLCTPGVVQGHKADAGGSVWLIKSGIVGRSGLCRGIRGELFGSWGDRSGQEKAAQRGPDG